LDILPVANPTSILSLVEAGWNL